MKKKALLNKKLKRFASFFDKQGYSCYLVGGALRNFYASLTPSDYDFATDASPEQVIKLFRHVIPTGIKHGTVTVLFEGEQFEVTTFRIESTYSNARHPDSVTYSSSIYEDLKRRDFSINAIALNMVNGELIDPHDGIGDINKKLIRAIGNPVERFGEDGLRLLRACRFTSQLNFHIEKDTLKAMRICRENIIKVSAERVRDEIIRILRTNKPSRAFRVMEDTGILELILPEFTVCRGVEQKGFHRFDVLDHLFYSCDGADQTNLEVRLAALLHDLGKVETGEKGKEGVVTFYNHEVNSASICKGILKRLKFPNNTIKKTCHLVREHMFNYTPQWSDAAIRRFITRVGVENLDDLFKLRRADQFGMENKPVDPDYLFSLAKRVNAILESESALSMKDLDIDGEILQRELNLKRGPVVGTILNELFESVLDDPLLNKREILLGIAKKFLKNNFVQSK